MPAFDWNVTRPSCEGGSTLRDVGIGFPPEIAVTRALGSEIAVIMVLGSEIAVTRTLGSEMAVTRALGSEIAVTRALGSAAWVSCRDGCQSLPASCDDADIAHASC